MRGGDKNSNQIKRDRHRENVGKWSDSIRNLHLTFLRILFSYSFFFAACRKRWKVDWRNVKNVIIISTSEGEEKMKKKKKKTGKIYRKTEQSEQGTELEEESGRERNSGRTWMESKKAKKRNHVIGGTMKLVVMKYLFLTFVSEYSLLSWREGNWIVKLDWPFRWRWRGTKEGSPHIQERSRPFSMYLELARFDPRSWILQDRSCQDQSSGSARPLGPGSILRIKKSWNAGLIPDRSSILGQCWKMEKIGNPTWQKCRKIAIIFRD